MADYIDREAFISDKRKQYCENCNRRKGVKNGKMRLVYDIGDAPCRACGIEDMLAEVEEYPAADVRPVVLCRNCKLHDKCSTEDVFKFARLSDENRFCGVGADMRGKENAG